jgi:hypothetical protein
MSGLTRSTVLEGLGFLLCSAAPTAPGAADLASGRGLDARDGSGACDRHYQVHAGPAAAA